MGGEVVERRHRALGLHRQDDDVAVVEGQFVDPLDGRDVDDGRAARVVDGQAVGLDRPAVRATGDEHDLVAVALPMLVEAATDDAADRAGAEHDDAHVSGA